MDLRPCNSRNRFQAVSSDKSLETAGPVFEKVRELALEETLLEWNEICHVTSRFRSLASLSCGMNQLPTISCPLPATLSSTLTVLNLEFNEFNSLSDLSKFSSLKALRNLHLKGNNISAITSDSSAQPPTFPESIQYVDLSYNQVPSWSFVDGLGAVFPGLKALRLAHNPIYESASISDNKQDPTSTTTEEAHMITVARLPTLTTLNFVAITAGDRENAEMFYLSRIAKALATVPEEAEPEILKDHPLYEALCEVYGAPDVIRRQETNPEFLESRLIDVTFRYAGDDGVVTRMKAIPHTFDIYAVKGMAARLFGLSPPRTRLVWETGEWDPVAGFDEQEGDSSDEEEGVVEAEMGWAVWGEGEGRKDEEEVAANLAGRWLKREVELRDSPRALRFCVDGQEAKIRVERR